MKNSQVVELHPPDTEAKPLHVPDGVYTAVCAGHRTGIYFARSPKLELIFELVDARYLGRQISRYYNVRRLVGRHGKNGDFKVKGWRSDFIREHALCFGVPLRLDRIPMTKYQGAVMRCRIKTVKRDWRQREMVTGLEYSVVTEILGLDSL